MESSSDCAWTKALKLERVLFNVDLFYLVVNILSYLCIAVHIYEALLWKIRLIISLKVRVYEE